MTSLLEELPTLLASSLNYSVTSDVIQSVYCAPISYFSVKYCYFNKIVIALFAYKRSCNYFGGTLTENITLDGRVAGFSAEHDVPINNNPVFSQVQ